MSDSSLQKYNILLSNQQSPLREKLVFEFPIINEIQNYLELDRTCEVDLLDITISKNSVYVLSAIVNLDSNTFNYCIIELSDISNTPKLVRASLINYEFDYLDTILTTSILYIISDIYLVLNYTAVILSKGSNILDKFLFAPSNQNLFGYGYYLPNTLYLFNNKHGLLQLPLRDALEKHPSVSTVPTSISSINIDNSSINNTKEQLSNIFRKYVLEDKELAISQYQSIWQSKPIQELEDAIIQLNDSILNALPTSDPRWGQAIATPNSTVSVLISQHLQDKLRKHSHFIEFISNNPIIWNQVSSSVKQQVLFQSEKLTAAIKLRNYQNSQEQNYGTFKILVDAIKKFTSTRKILDSFLTEQDIFYSNITQLEEILFHIQEVLQSYLLSSPTDKDSQFKYLDQSSNIFIIFCESLTPATWNALIPRVNMSIKSILENQIKITFDTTKELNLYFADVSKPKIDSLFNDLFVLSDLLLSYYSNATTSSNLLRYEEKESIQSNFPSTRSQIIIPFVNEKKLELAFQLAEKYQDFKILASLLLNENERLQFYLQKYRTDRFPIYYFELLLQIGRYEELFNYFELGYQQELELVLTPYPHLKWVLFVQQANYSASSNALFNLAATENRELIARKTWASLSKLSCLVSLANPSNMSEFQLNTNKLKNSEDMLYLVKAQERFRDKFSLEDSSVLSAEQLIDLFLNQPVDILTSADILNALNIYSNTISLLTSPSSILNKIWLIAFNSTSWDVMASDWEQGNETDSTVQQKIHNAIFYQVASDERAQGLLTNEILSSILTSYQSQHPNNTPLTRLLSTVFSLFSVHIE